MIIFSFVTGTIKLPLRFGLNCVSTSLENNSASEKYQWLFWGALEWGDVVRHRRNKIFHDGLSRVYSLLRKLSRVLSILAKSVWETWKNEFLVARQRRRLLFRTSAPLPAWSAPLCNIVWGKAGSYNRMRSFASHNFDQDCLWITEAKKSKNEVEAVLVGFVVPLCQRNSRRLDEADREVIYLSSWAATPLACPQGLCLGFFVFVEQRAASRDGVKKEEWGEGGEVTTSFTFCCCPQLSA